MTLALPASTAAGIEAAIEATTLIISINRPAVRNAIDPPAASALAAMLDYYDAHDDLRVAIITGNGEAAFCAGFDLKYAQAHPEVLDNENLFSDVVRRVGGYKPLIAAVNGVAFGLGLELALACDLILCSPHAEFALPEPRVGLAAMGGGIVRLTRQIGLKRALGLILSAKPVSAQEAHRLGFVNDIVHEGAVLDGARRWASMITECGPRAIQASKQIAYENFDKPDLQTALDPGQYTQARALLASDEPHIGRDAFFSRTQAEWPLGGSPAKR